MTARTNGKLLNRGYPFPQADTPARILDVVEAICRGPADDQVLSQAFSLHPRQCRYYADAAGFLGLVRFSGGFWRPQPLGETINGMADENARQRLLGELVVKKTVFREAAIHLAQTGTLPPLDEVESWIRAVDDSLNDETASRRAQTVHAWVSHVAEQTPEVVAALAPSTACALRVA